MNPTFDYDELPTSSHERVEHLACALARTGTCHVTGVPDVSMAALAKHARDIAGIVKHPVAALTFHTHHHRGVVSFEDSRMPAAVPTELAELRSRNLVADCSAA